MASSSGASSGGTLRTSSSEEDFLQGIKATTTSPPSGDDTRKRKRMLSNRESARRSRMRKQKHLDDLSSQLAQLRKENGEILASMNVTTQLFLNVEAENCVLRAQMAELGTRLDALNEILIGCVNNSGDVSICGGGGDDGWFLWGSNNNFNGMINLPPAMDMVMY